jgi:nitrite reductase (cytochrome c-552)
VVEGPSDRTASQIVRSGYATATVVKLFEMANKAQESGKNIDMTLYNKAKDYYEEAFYRSVFVGAENSVGFHNPMEAMRILGDTTAFAIKAEGLLGQAPAKAGVDVPVKVDLELHKHLDNWGEKKLKGNPNFEFKDPTEVQYKM